ncbi:MAG: D-amino-acid oxidase [Phenylobacterium zucineum]|nr:MAG: D-amino-acid oxidase [Phenylobacterium zucineum]
MSELQFSPADRRRFLRGAAAIGGFGLLGGCASAGTSPPKPGFRPTPLLAPVKASPERIFHISVCLRPFRAAGPRMDAETVGDKLVVHNYGHGGSGWSLSWGAAAAAVKTAFADGVKDVAVIGCGAMGLTAATVAQRAGARVTIYAKEPILETRSARATGVWSPDSRIAKADAVDAGFATRWEEMARTSFRVHQQYLGLADAPVEWTERYILSDMPSGGGGEDPMGFAAYGRRILDLSPRSQVLEPGEHPFATRFARRHALPMFNVTEYARVLMADFQRAGGRFEVTEFRSPADLARLKERVVIDCTGYGARALWKDESVVPVRGQLAWLIPQPEVTYGLAFQGVGTVSRRDGMIIQANGPDESYGYNDATETPDRQEAERAVAVIASLFARKAAARA